MQIAFSKMHGLGNDFVVIDAIRQTVNLSKTDVRRIADRHEGIGCDQLLLVEASDHPQADFRYRIFNANGNEVEHCGNGARCFALFVRMQGLTQKSNIPVITRNGLITLMLQEDNMVTVDMGAPRFSPQDIPLNQSKAQMLYTLTIDKSSKIKELTQEQKKNINTAYNEGNLSLQYSALSVGNPHAVLLSDDVTHAPVQQLGAFIEQHNDFPAQVNVGFMQVINRDFIQLRVFERGVGETRACGTGACAAVVAGIQRGLLNHRVHAKLTGGSLIIEWQGENTPILMTGPATHVFTGSIAI